MRIKRMFLLLELSSYGSIIRSHYVPCAITESRDVAEEWKKSGPDRKYESLPVVDSVDQYIRHLRGIQAANERRRKKLALME